MTTFLKYIIIKVYAENFLLNICLYQIRIVNKPCIMKFKSIMFHYFPWRWNGLTLFCKSFSPFIILTIFKNFAVFTCIWYDRVINIILNAKKCRFRFVQLSNAIFIENCTINLCILNTQDIECVFSFFLYHIAWYQIVLSL